MLDPRPSLAPALEALLLDIVSRVPDFAGVAATDVLIVALGAHATAAASVRALDGLARGVVVDDKRRRIELGLRPPFFLDGDAPRRLATLIHEVLHLDPATPGRLDDAYRHNVRPHARLEREARALAKDYLRVADATLLLPLAHDGEVLMRTWRHRPFESTARRRFTDDDLFEAPVRMVTPRGSRGGWW